MADRPIKINKEGKYNLNFIDWNNEYEAISNHLHDPDFKENDCPIPGMSR